MSNCARIVVAGVSSGSGKTTVTCALAMALRRKGLSVVTFKCGPDYLDPTYHTRASGSASHNLDGWMMGRAAVLETFARVSQGHDIAIIEGVMGLFDGADPSSEEGSTAQVAKWLDAPVLLVVDASGMARSFAALVNGFLSFDRELRIPAVLANRVGSQSHLAILRTALSCLGAPEATARAELQLFGLPKQKMLSFPERHLGLRTADAAVPDASFEGWADVASSWIDLDTLLALASRSHVPLAPVSASRPSCCRIGVAHDEAFHFYYEHNLQALEAQGATLVRFSPCRDDGLPADLDGLYLGGGYPELHARALSDNTSMREAIASFARRGGPIYAECGGLMYLTRAIQTLSGERFPMVGLFAREAHMADRLQALGYAEVETSRATLLGPAGLRLRGHQFRYSDLHGEQPLETAYTVRVRRSGNQLAEGYVLHNVLASYIHAHWGENSEPARAFVASCQRFRASQETADSSPAVPANPS